MDPSGPTRIATNLTHPNPRLRSGIFHFVRRVLIGMIGTQTSGDAFSGDQAFNSAANNGGFATWTFNNLIDGIYEVFVTSDQTGQSNVTTAAPFTASDGGGLFHVNQRVGINPDLIFAQLDAANRKSTTKNSISRRSWCG